MHPLLEMRLLRPRSQRQKFDPGRYVYALLAASVLVLGLMRWLP